MQSDEFVASLLSNPEAMKHLKGMSRHNVGGWSVADASERRICQENAHVNGTGLSCVMTLKSGEFVGICGFREIVWWNRSAEMGIILHPTYWGRGYCVDSHLLCLTYGFEDLCLNRIEFKTSVHNTAMINFLKNVLLATQEGVLRDYFPLSHNATGDSKLLSSSDNYESVAWFSILAHEWPATKQSLLAKSRR